MEKIRAMTQKAAAVLLTLCLLLTLAPAAMAAEPALPKVGDTVHGFTVKEKRDFPLIGAEMILFEHGKTGAKLVYIANEDTDRAFDLTFLTEAVDNTGLPHVFEHSTLDGSDKYPSKALFFNLIYQTYNTFMNAMTYQWMTSYPVASLSEAQLLKYADYYTDSCLHPMILKDESIYREEAWRYRMADEDSPLTIEGTVYSEMLGAIDLSSAAYTNSIRTAFPGSRAGNESGGDPEYIPDMTWQMLKDYHDAYYHPSNCLAFLYGKFEDYTAFLKLLDDAFSPYEKSTVKFREDAGYTPITAPVVKSYPFAVESGSDTKNASTVYYSVVCPGLTGRDKLVLNTLTDLLTSDASALQQALKKALPSGSFGCYIESVGPEPAIVFAAENVGKDDGETFKKTVDAALAEVAKNGFPQDLVDAVMTSSSIDTMLVSENGEVGVNMIQNIAYYYSYDRELWGFPDYVEALDKMDEWNSQGLYAKAVGQYLIGSKTTALTTTYPEPGLKEKNDAALAEKLAAVKASMSAEEIAAVIAASNAADDGEDDASKYIAQLQAVTVQSLPEETRAFDVTDTTKDGVRHIDAVAGVDGIGQVALLLDAAGVPQEELHWFQLFTALVGETDTAKHSREEIATLSGRYLYNGNTYVSLTEQDGFHPYLRMGWISLDDDLAEGYDLMREMVFEAKVDDAQTVLENVQALRASLKSSINASPYSVQLRRALATESELYRYQEYLNGLDYYAFLADAEQLLETKPEEAVAHLVGVQKLLNNSTNAVAIFAGNKDSIALNRPLADKFLASLGKASITPAAYDLPVPAESEGLVIDGNVQFNALVASFDDLGLDEYDGGMDAVTSLVTDTFLYPLLRDQYGAYGVFHGCYGSDGVYIISYRDPNVGETFAVYDSLPELIAELDLDQDTLDGYILSSYVGYAMPQGELSGALGAAFGALEDKDQDETLTYMKQLKAITPETFAKYAALYEKLVDNGVRSTSGSAAKINANAERYEAILDPFGVKDAPAAVFGYADVAEGAWEREAVEFVWENDLMGGISETAFAPAQKLTKGELGAAFYGLYTMLTTGAGEIVDPQEGMAWASELGLLDGNADDVLTREELVTLVYELAEAFGLDVSADDALGVFADGGSVSAGARDAMSWAVSAGLINGVGDGLLAPAEPATRAQAASVLMRLFTNVLMG